MTEMKPPVLALAMLGALLAVAPAQAQQVGVLLAHRMEKSGVSYVQEYQTGHLQYRTLWLVLSPTEAKVVAEVPDIIAPRATGFWRVGTTVLCGPDGTTEVVWQTPIARAPVVAGTPCPPPDTSVADTVAASADSGCSANEAEILFVSPTHIADQFTRKQTEACEPRGGRWQDSNEVRAFDGDARVSLADVLGPAVERAYAAAIAEGYRDVTKEVNCPPLEAGDFDFASWGIKHIRGIWRAVAMDNAVGGECEYAYEIDLPLPARLTSDASAAQSWPAMARAIPGLTDYFTAPGGAFVVAIAEPTPGDAHLVAYAASAGTPQRRLLDVTFPTSSPILMAQWAVGARSVGAWTGVIEEIRRHPLPRVVGGHEH